MPDVLMVRHCEAAGWANDSPLTQSGYAEANKLINVFKDLPIDYIVSSPFLRAYETIEPFAKFRNLDIHTDDRLAERRRRGDNGKIDNWEEWVRQSFLDLDHRAVGGESGREVAQRGLAVLREMLSSDYQLPMLSSHGQLLSFLAHSFDPSFAYEASRLMGFPAIFRFSAQGQDIKFEIVAIA